MSIYLVLESQFDKMHLNFPIYRLDMSDDSTLGNDLFHKIRYTKKDTLVMSIRVGDENVHEIYESLQTKFDTYFRRHREFGIAYYSGDGHSMCDMIYEVFVQHRDPHESHSIDWYNRL